MSVAFDQLTSQVIANETVEGSVIQLLKNIAAKLANSPTPAEVAALSASLNSSAEALTDSVIANTPVKPVPDKSLESVPGIQ
jgi:hypothetical protein